jgi:hypothetical protein
MNRHATLLTICAIACATSPGVRGDEVTDWAQIFLNSAIAANTAPYTITRYSAIVHGAVFDAVNGIERKYTPVHVPPAAPPGASTRAAAVEAAYIALVNLYPAQKSTLDASLSASLAGIASGEAVEHSVSIQRGILWGQYVANQILAWRSTDGFSE